MSQQFDNVTKPAHYNFGAFEPADVIEDWNLPWNLGNAVGYIARAGRKDPSKYIEDLEKAANQIQRQINLERKRASSAGTVGSGSPDQYQELEDNIFEKQKAYLEGIHKLGPRPCPSPGMIRGLSGPLKPAKPFIGDIENPGSYSKIHTVEKKEDKDK